MAYARLISQHRGQWREGRKEEGKGQARQGFVIIELISVVYRRDVVQESLCEVRLEGEKPETRISTIIVVIRRRRR